MKQVLFAGRKDGHPVLVCTVHKDLVDGAKGPIQTYDSANCIYCIKVPA